jgi:hypothetical protein
MAIENIWLLKRMWACVIILENNPWFPFLVIEKFWSPFDGGGVLDGDGKKLVTLHITTVAIKKNQSPQKVN